MAIENIRHAGSFLMVIELDSTGAVNSDQVAVAGRVLRGIVAIGADLDLIGFAPQTKRVKLVDIVTRGRLTSYIIQGAVNTGVVRGQVLADPGTMHLGTTFEAEVVFDERYEKITQQPFQGVTRHLFHIWDTDIFGALHLPKGKATIAHGDQFAATIELAEPCALEVGLDFGIGRLLGRGRVTAILAQC